MAIKVTLSNKSRVTERSPHLIGVDHINMSRHTYQMLGSMVKNKVILDAYNNGTLPEEYKRLLDELNDLHIVKNYPKLASGITLKEGIEELDEYLGSLGMDQEYPYSKDILNIAQWVDADDRPEYRYLYDESDNTVLMDGTELLVSYT